MWVHIGAQKHANSPHPGFNLLQRIYHEANSQLFI